MSYFGQSSRFAGDPGFFGTLARVAGRVGRGVLSGVTGGLSEAAITTFAPQRQQIPTIPSFPVVKTPGIKGAVQRTLPGGATGFQVMGVPRRKRRRMNYTNLKALRRSNRRVDGFVREVKKSLKHTPFKLVSKHTSSRPRKDLGAGHTHVR